MDYDKDRAFDEDLNILRERSQKSPSLSIKEILEILSGKGRMIVLIFLSLPFCQPLQLPGMAIPFGIIISIFGIRIAFGHKIWLPKKILSKKIKAKTIQKIADKTILMISKMKRLIHPRLSWICDHGIMQIMNGLLIFVMGILLALPIPIPLTNITAGWSIFLVSLGLLENDGACVLAGYLISLLTIIFFILILISIPLLF